MASPDSVSFCEGCPFAGGVEEMADTFQVSGFAMRWPNPGFEISFTDKNSGDVTKSVHVVVNGSIDSSMPQGTAASVRDKVKHCTNPESVEVKRLAGIAGKKVVERCGAFPGQKPKHVKVKAQATGWFHPEDFL